ncbi:MAG: DNA translocase FtsK 4TM domain-containing protein [Massiliimalia sp.]|jgi:S-DNA-T family DNA segregation ATPase FtsK/SpoIIIE
MPTKKASKPAARKTSSSSPASSGKGQRKGKTSSGKKETAAAKAMQQELHKRQVWAVILFFSGLLVGAMTLIQGQNLWELLHNWIFGMFGIASYLVAPMLLFIAVRVTIRPEIGRIRHKLWQAGVFIALLCGMIQVAFMKGYPGEGLEQVWFNLFNLGQDLRSGGVVSLLFGWPLQAACGTVGATIILVLFLLAMILLLSGSTLLDAFHTVSKPVKKMEDNYIRAREEREERQEQEEQRRQAGFNIDVDLGPDPVVEEMPQHPVSSPKQAQLQPVLDELEEKIPPQTESPAQSFLNVVEETKQKAMQTREEKKQEKQEQLDALVERAVPKEPETTPKEAVREILEEEIGERGAKQESTEGEPPFNPGAAVQIRQYQYPPISLLKAPVNRPNADLSEELKMNAELLVNTLKSFGVQTRIIDISRGPTVTRYELQPSAGVKISKITNLADDIALNLAAGSVRIEAPIPNKAAVGIEVPNKKTEVVTMREIVDSVPFKNAKSKLSVALGKDISGTEVICDIAKMPHMLIAGSTGSGKSVCINSIIISLLYKATPDEVKLLMIDPKIVELGAYNGIPHLLVPVVTDPRKAAGALGWAVTEMLNRYKLFADNGVRDLTGYNELANTKEELNPMPQIVIVIDELADLMMAAPNEVEDAICRLAQMARAAGMHLVIATQRPSVDVITGLIKANIPSRIAFAVSSQIDSRTILDQGGAEKLLGKGDMMFAPVGVQKPTRLQGCFVTDQERDQVIEFVKNSTNAAEYDDKIMDEIEKQAVQEKGKEKGNDGGGFEEEDPLMNQAIECVVEAGQASTSYLQRRLKVGYARAARLIDDMEAKGIVGPFEGSKPRQVMITKNQWAEMKLNQDTLREGTSPENV